LFLYKLVIYHLKGFKEIYNFVIENTSFKIHMSYDHTKFQTHLFSKDIVAPQGNLSPYFLGTWLALGSYSCSKGKGTSKLPLRATISLKKEKPKLP
jgi:hypothetical protein